MDKVLKIIKRYKILKNTFLFLILIKIELKK
jgi:hypothetical protein